MHCIAYSKSQAVLVGHRYKCHPTPSYRLHPHKRPECTALYTIPWHQQSNSTLSPCSKKNPCTHIASTLEMASMATANRTNTNVAITTENDICSYSITHFTKQYYSNSAITLNLNKFACLGGRAQTGGARTEKHRCRWCKRRHIGNFITAPSAESPDITFYGRTHWISWNRDWLPGSIRKIHSVYLLSLLSRLTFHFLNTVVLCDWKACVSLCVCVCV